jgi:hypothetical protein
LFELDLYLVILYESDFGPRARPRSRNACNSRVRRSPRCSPRPLRLRRWRRN